MMLKKIYSELVAIRKELHGIKAAVKPVQLDLDSVSDEVAVGIALKETFVETSGLSDAQKFKCIARWLNTLYLSFADGKTAEAPCGRCPHYMKECGCNIPPQDNFKVLEKITGDGTVVSHLINQRTGLL